jgi:hypothetical protein
MSWVSITEVNEQGIHKLLSSIGGEFGSF